MNQNNEAKKCERCDGKKTIEVNDDLMDLLLLGVPLGLSKKTETCPRCNGSGTEK